MICGHREKGIGTPLRRRRSLTLTPRTGGRWEGIMGNAYGR